MNIPKAWVRASIDVTRPSSTSLTVSAWGWGANDAEARQTAVRRLANVADRIRRGESFPDQYAYSAHPVREEILRSEQPGSDGEPTVMVTRNRYGAEVLNASRVLFLDIDFPQRQPFEWLRRLLGRQREPDRLLDTLRDALRQSGASFRLYRTANGFRAIGIDRRFEPTAEETLAIMDQTGTDPAYRTLCQAQQCFRARLTPKPWRCGIQLPPGRHPRDDDSVRVAFSNWLAEYQTASASYATCQYLETIGEGSPEPDIAEIIDVHDHATRATADFMLA